VQPLEFPLMSRKNLGGRIASVVGSLSFFKRSKEALAYANDCCRGSNHRGFAHDEKFDYSAFYLFDFLS
jgi:hypothetical protein